MRMRMRPKLAHRSVLRRRHAQRSPPPPLCWPAESNGSTALFADIAVIKDMDQRR